MSGEYVADSFATGGDVLEQENFLGGFSVFGGGVADTLDQTALSIGTAIAGPANPNAARIRSSMGSTCGRLPLHLAIASGKPWSEGIKSILSAYPDAISKVDPKTAKSITEERSPKAFSSRPSSAEK